eukprot:2055940-Pleurochrysis_carterae.AAC.1
MALRIASRHSGYCHVRMCHQTTIIAVRHRSSIQHYYRRYRLWRMRATALAPICPDDIPEVEATCIRHSVNAAEGRPLRHLVPATS